MVLAHANAIAIFMRLSCIGHLPPKIYTKLTVNTIPYDTSSSGAICMVCSTRRFCLCQRVVNMWSWQLNPLL